MINESSARPAIARAPRTHDKQEGFGPYLPRRNRMAAPALISLLVCASFSGAVDAQEWTRFRGPNGSGECEADGIPVTWGEKDLLWKVKMPGAGHSSPVIWDNRVFITSTDDDASKFVSCFNIADGSDVWKRSFPGTV